MGRTLPSPIAILYSELLFLYLLADVLIEMAGSIEYEVLIRHTIDLQVAVRANLTLLGAQLVTLQIITPDQYEEIRNAHRPVNERVADLIGYVQNKVRQNPWHYHAFLGALRCDPSQYGDILMKLEQARLSQASERQPMIPQPPPPREDDNRLPAQGILFLLVLSRFCIVMDCIQGTFPNYFKSWTPLPHPLY